MTLTPEQERHVLALVENSDVRDKLVRDAEAKRAEEETSLREDLAKNEARLAARNPKLHAAVEAARVREVAARKERDDALEAHSQAFRAQEQLHEEYWAVRHRVESLLRRVADPRITALAKELRDFAAAPPTRALPHEEFSSRVLATVALAEETERLLICPSLTATSLTTELDRIRDAFKATWA